MKLKKSWIVGTVAAALVAVVTPLSPATSAFAAAPGWEPDANSNGTITFYDSTGAVITGGNDLSHLFDYAAASSAEDPTGFHKAAIFFGFPDHTKTNTTDWFASTASAASTYPVASPASLASITDPVATTTGSAVNLTAALGGATLDTTPGYADIVQVRMIQSGGTNFWASDISYNTTSGTWSQVYPVVATATQTTTTLATSPSSPQAPGTAVDLTATVGPSGAAGTVQFADGGTSIGSPVTVSADHATINTGALAAGAHSFTATFTPTDSGAFAASSSAATTFLVGTVPGTPTGVSGVAGNGVATVSWSAPANNGGLPISGYDVRFSSDGGATWTPASAGFHTSTATTEQVTGLTNGASYLFEAAAINAIGTGAYSAPSTAVAPHADASKVAQAKSIAINYGATTTVSAKITDVTTNTALAGVGVKLLSRTSTSKPFALVKTIASNAAGVVALKVKPGVNTQYQWAFPGNGAHAAATSAIESVSVAQAVSVRATATRVPRRTTVKLWGGVAPNETGQYVYLQKRTAHGWQTVGKARLVRQKLPNGRISIGYVFSVRPSAAGRYSFRVLRPATSANAAGASATVTLTVR